MIVSNRRKVRQIQNMPRPRITSAKKRFNLYLTLNFASGSRFDQSYIRERDWSLEDILKLITDTVR